MLSLLTVSYNSADELKHLAQSLQQNPPPEPWEWIIADNNSNPKTIEFLKKLEAEKHIFVLFLQKNIGFGAANNLAAACSRGKVLVLLNPDTRATATSWKFAQIPKTNPKTTTCPRIITKTGQTLQNCRAFPTILGLLWRRISNRAQQNHSTGRFWCQGSALALSRKFFYELGGFDERFFLFFEDTDLCKRIWQQGGTIRQIPDSIIIHKSERLSGKGFPVFKKVFWIHAASAFLYFWKNK